MPSMVVSPTSVWVTGGGTVAGIKNIAGATSDIGMDSREATAEEISRFCDIFEEDLVGYDHPGWHQAKGPDHQRWKL